MVEQLEGGKSPESGLIKNSEIVNLQSQQS